MIRLTHSMREVLRALVRLHDRLGRYVKSREIAEEIGRDQGTVRNLMAALKSMGLVEARSGPDGGYRPTQKGREILKLPPVYGGDTVPLEVNGLPSGIEVLGIDLLDVPNPAFNRAVLKVAGDVRALRPGAKLRLGPTPFTRLVLEGEVASVDESRREVVLRVSRMVSIPRVLVASIMSRELVTLSPDQSLVEAAGVLAARGIRGAPVVDGGRLVGLFTTADLAAAVASGRLDGTVGEHCRRSVPTVGMDADILEVMRMMEEVNLGRLIVVDSSGRPVGIVTRTDVLRAIGAME